MSIKAGELIHVGGGGVLVDRIQTGGPGQVNINTEKIYELGNRESTGIVRDTPDLTFSLESFDVSTEIEAMLLNGDFGTDAAGTEYDISQALPLNVLSQFRAAENGISEIDVDFYIGYGVDSNPGELYFNGQPINVLVK